VALTPANKEAATKHPAELHMEKIAIKVIAILGR
jgi:hypothetical protein